MLDYNATVYSLVIKDETGFRTAAIRKGGWIKTTAGLWFDADTLEDKSGRVRTELDADLAKKEAQE